MTQEITEKELIILVVQRRTLGFSVLYERYASILFDVISKIVEDNEAAEELLERCFVKVWKDISDYQPEKEGFLTWMLNISRAQSIEYMREREADDPQRETTGATVLRIGPELDARQIEAIDMIFLKGYSYDEAAAFLQIPIEIVRSRVRTALQQLRKQR